MEELLAWIKLELRECKESPYFPDDDSKREGYIDALKTVIAYIEEDRR